MQNTKYQYLSVIRQYDDRVKDKLLTSLLTMRLDKDITPELSAYVYSLYEFGVELYGSPSPVTIAKSSSEILQPQTEEDVIDYQSTPEQSMVGYFELLAATLVEIERAVHEIDIHASQRKKMLGKLLAATLVEIERAVHEIDIHASNRAKMLGNMIRKVSSKIKYDHKI